ncbi:hypothetical protein G3N18_01945 [Microbacterium sp. 2C]|nr:hypothetical protein [Microbacterium paulum]
MSKTLDMLERVEHGTPAGFLDGCKSRGGCPNHGSRTLTTCAEAARARQRHYVLSKLDLSVEITRAMIRLARRADFEGVLAIVAAAHQVEEHTP